MLSSCWRTPMKKWSMRKGGSSLKSPTRRRMPTKAAHQPGSRAVLATSRYVVVQASNHPASQAFEGRRARSTSRNRAAAIPPLTSTKSERTRIVSVMSPIAARKARCSIRR